MPLRDHFHLPLAERRHWESFHAVWAAEIMRTLNRGILPLGCFAETQVHVGSRVEIDVATFERETRLSIDQRNENGGGVAVEAWAPAVAPMMSIWKAPTTRHVKIACCRN